MILSMISVNQGIGTSIPENVEKRKAHDILYQVGPLKRGGEKNLRMGQQWRTPYIYIYIYMLYWSSCTKLALRAS